MSNFNKDKYIFSSQTQLFLVGENIEEDRKQQINNFIRELISCKVLLRDLADKNISYSIRNELLNIAFYIINNYEYYNELIETGELPITKIGIKVKKDNKYLNTWKDYIIAYTIILGNPLYKLIQEYIQVSEYKPNSGIKDIDIFNDGNEIKGLVLLVGKTSAIILTSLGEFKKVKVTVDCKKGAEFKGKEKKGLKEYKLYMSILMILLAIIIGVGGFNYKNSVTTIVVKSNVTIKLQVNIFNMIVEADSISQEGTEIIKKLDITDRTLDTALYRIVKYINDEDMIPESGIIVTISGKPMKYGVINKSEDYIYVNNVQIKFNNSGIEHKLN